MGFNGDTMGFTIPLTSTFEELDQSWFKPLALFISPEGFDGKWLTAWVTVVVGQDPSTPKCCRWRSQHGVPSQRVWPTKFKKIAAGFCSFSEASMNEMAWWMSAKWPPGEKCRAFRSGFHHPCESGVILCIHVYTIYILYKLGDYDLVGGLEHVLFFHILGITIPTD